MEKLTARVNFTGKGPRHGHRCLHTWNSGAAALLVLVAGCLSLVSLAGCEDSEQAEAQKTVVENIDQANRLVQSSRQDIPTDQQLAKQAGGKGQLNDARAEALAQQAVDRIEEQYDWTTLESTLATIDQLAAQLDSGDKQKLLEMTSQLTVAVENLAGQHSAVAQNWQQVSLDRLAQAEKSLRSASQAVRSLDDSSVQAAPTFLIGMINAVRARDLRNQMMQQETHVETERIILARQTAHVLRERHTVDNIKDRLPDAAIEYLKAQLYGNDSDVPGVVQDLAQAEKRLAETTADRDQAQREYERLRDKAIALDREYLQLIENAEATRGQERFDYYTRAYELRTGKDEKGLIEYEALRDEAETKFMVAQREMEYAQLRHEQLSQQAEVLAARIQELENSPVIEEVKTAVAQQEELMAKVQAELENQIQVVNSAEEQYNALLVETDDAYDTALDSYKQAQGMARGDRNMRDYAEASALGITTELMTLWMDNAAHHDAAASTYAIVEQLDNGPALMGDLRLNHEKMAQQAREQISQLNSEIEEAMPDEPEEDVYEEEPEDFDDNNEMGDNGEMSDDTSMDDEETDVVDEEESDEGQ